MNPFSEFHCDTLSDISNRTIYQAKRHSLTAISTELTHANPTSPISSIKKSFAISPQSVANKFWPSLKENSFFSVPVKKKRQRDEINLSENKKFKCERGPVTKMITELFDPDNQITLAFRCFREIEIIKDKNIGKKIIHNECDDDCPTDDLQIEACIEFMSKEIEQALTNYNI